ncbi:MAG: ATP synthase F1 subunit delta [Cyanobacteria bacterium MAG IRC1_bin_28]|nr:ATP synthase F1 subunit delta [Cyanobacteria bacterium MAG IRC1_bin_28]
MPLLNTIATPYAEALLQIGSQQGTSDDLAADAKAVLEIWTASGVLRDALGSPVLEPETKKAVITALFQEKDVLRQTASLNLLKLLADRQRISLTGVVFERFLELYRKAKGIALAQVTSATPLTPEQEERLKQKVQAMAGSAAVDCSITVDPSLIGGLIVRIGSRVVDASLAGQVRRLGRSLAKAA